MPVIGPDGMTSWTRFQAWPGWAQAAACVFLTPLPLARLVTSRRPRLVRAVAALIAVTWLAAALLLVTEVAPPRLWAATGVAVTALGLLYAIVFVLPARLVPVEGLTREQILKAHNDVRLGLLNALALGGALVPAYGGLRQSGLHREELRQNREVSRQTLELTRNQQIAERYTRAAAQLGSEELEIRVWAIDELERIARDSQAKHSSVMAVLAAFLSEQAPPASQDGQARNVEALAEGETASAVDGPRLPADVQAALTVIGRRTLTHDGRALMLNLSGIDVRGANLAGANLREAALRGAGLRAADLRAADLGRSSLVNASLREANLEEANLEEADLRGADLRRARLLQADLGRAQMVKANLREAKLEGANLRGADLRMVDLRGADLRGADLRGANLGGADLSEADLRGADLIRAHVEAHVKDATRWPAGFSPAAAGVVIEPAG